MMPPTFDGQLRVNMDAPISKWQYYASFDSAQECESERAFVFKQAQKFTQAQRTNPRTMEESTASQELSGHCVATDDPRLKGN